MPTHVEKEIVELEVTASTTEAETSLKALTSVLQNIQNQTIKTQVALSKVGALQPGQKNEFKAFLKDSSAVVNNWKEAAANGKVSAEFLRTQASNIITLFGQWSNKLDVLNVQYNKHANILKDQETIQLKLNKLASENLSMYNKRTQNAIIKRNDLQIEVSQLEKHNNVATVANQLMEKKRQLYLANLDVERALRESTNDNTNAMGNYNLETAKNKVYMEASNNLLTTRLGKLKVSAQQQIAEIRLMQEQGVAEEQIIASKEKLRKQLKDIDVERTRSANLAATNAKREADYNSLLTMHAAKRAVGYSVLFGAIATVTAATGAMAKNVLEADLNMRTMGAVLNLNTSAATSLSNSVRNLGEAYGGTLSEIDNVALSLGRAGIAQKDIVASTKIVLSMARLTGDTFEQSANAIISFQQVFGKTTSIDALGNKLAYIANVSRLSTQDIGTFSNYALAAAQAAGLTEDAVGGMAAAFSNAGVNASTIGTQIRTFAGLLTETTADTEQFFTGIGVNQQYLAAQIQQGGAASNKALLGFVNTLSNLDDIEFNRLTGNMDKLTANVLNLMKHNKTNIDQFVIDLQNGAEGQLSRVDLILDAHIVSWEKAWNKILNLSDKVAKGASEGLTNISIDQDITNLKAKLSGRNSVGFMTPSDTERKALQEQLNQLEMVKAVREADTKIEELNTKAKVAQGEELKAIVSERLDLEVKAKAIRDAIAADDKNKQQEIKKLEQEAINTQLAAMSEKLTSYDIESKQYKDILKQMEELANVKKDLDKPTTLKLSVEGLNIADLAKSIKEDVSEGITVSEAKLQTFFDLIKQKQDENTSNRQQAIEQASKLSDEYRNKLAALSTTEEGRLELMKIAKERADILGATTKDNAKTLAELSAEQKESYGQTVGLINSLLKYNGVFNTLFKDAKDVQKSVADSILTTVDNKYELIKINSESSLQGKGDVAIAKEALRIIRESNAEKRKGLEAKQISLSPADEFKMQKDEAQAVLELSKEIQREKEKGATSDETAEKARQRLVRLEEEHLKVMQQNASKQKELIQAFIDEDYTKVGLAQKNLNIAIDEVNRAEESLRLNKEATLEKKLQEDLEIAKTKLLELSFKSAKAINDENARQADAYANINDSIDEALNKQEIRLGLTDKERLNEVEKLRLKALQADLDDKELQELQRKIDLLEIYTNKRKSSLTAFAEYQAKINKEEEAGYYVAQAALTQLETGMMDFFDITSQGWLDWHSLASGVLNSIYKQLLQQLIIKQLVSGIAGGISSAIGNVSTATTYGTNIGSQQTSMLQAQDMDFANGGLIPSKGYAQGGLLTGGSGMRDDLYLGNVGGTQVFAMGGEFITTQSSVNNETRPTLDYINRTGKVPSSTQGTLESNVNIPVSINIENQTGQAISADMIESLTKTNDKGEYEKVVNIVLKASVSDPRMRNLLKGGR